MSMRTCEGCLYWSELLAQCEDGCIKAMCLNWHSPHYQKYTWDGCVGYTVGLAIDDPSRHYDD